MALKTQGRSAVVEPPQKQEQAVVKTMDLSLALYTRLTIGKGENAVTYEKFAEDGVTPRGYRFKEDIAIRLLQRMDHGRPIWKAYQKPRPVQKPVNVIVDASKMGLDEDVEPIHGIDATEVTPDRQITLPEKRVDVGSDEELQEMGIPVGPDDVTV